MLEANARPDEPVDQGPGEAGSFAMTRLRRLELKLWQRFGRLTARTNRPEFGTLD